MRACAECQASTQRKKSEVLKLIVDCSAHRSYKLDCMYRIWSDELYIYLALAVLLMSLLPAAVFFCRVLRKKKNEVLVWCQRPTGLQGGLPSSTGGSQVVLHRGRPPLAAAPWKLPLHGTAGSQAKKRRRNLDGLTLGYIVSIE